MTSTDSSPPRTALRVGIVGAGRMGSGLLDLFRSHGIDVAVVDVADPITDLAGCDIVLEAVPEDLALKRSVVARVQQALNPTAILSTTSSLTAAAISEGLTAPARVVLWHPFNPVAKRPLVEMASLTRSLDAEGRAAREAGESLAAACDRVVLATYDSPGLVVNRVLKRWTHAGLRALDQGWSAASVDAAFIARGFRMGPVSVVRLVEPAVSLAVSRNLYAAFGDRFEPPAALVGATHGDTSLDGGTCTLDADDIVAGALDEVRDEIDRVLADGLVPAGPAALAQALIVGAGWPEAVVAPLHAW